MNKLKNDQLAQFNNIAILLNEAFASNNAAILDVAMHLIGQYRASVIQNLPQAPTPEAKYGYKADGTPRAKPGRKRKGRK